MSALKKSPLVDLVAARGYDIDTARSLILAGRVKVNGAVESRANVAVAEDAQISVTPGREYAGRGAYKLLGALDSEELRDMASEHGPRDRVCVDLGASHGGFTQVLLERGARRVYAVDVAYGILDYALRRDERVVPLEKRNARNITAEWFDTADLADPRGWFVAGDLSFISIRRILEALVKFRKSVVNLDCLLLIKPQFEASEATVDGVLEDAAMRTEIVAGVVEHARELGYVVRAVLASELRGAKGNVEYFLWAALR